ncbi:MAG: NADH-quinone oxidoreductase subunit A [Candidatus Heimdallarchaeota archaeon]|nr:NADH-quinone oxidoreductase subunit A [Candidatus Heimdallarchaeota archaeon]MCK5298394.1 NADH-quinone oxidoreductase subunit A [Candidatus Heimdallarchaeota archaeon]
MTFEIGQNILWIALVLVLVAVLLLYWLGKRMAPHNPSKEKLKSYACGEDIEGGQQQFYPNVFIFAIYFTIFDILAFTIATAMIVVTQKPWAPGFSAVAAIFAGIGLLGVISLRR